MSYENWLAAHIGKKNIIVTKLVVQGYDKARIKEYFDFDNMRVCEPNFCPLYAQNIKCHDIKQLNCFYCACPYFILDGNDASCEKNLGDSFMYEQKRIQDCTNCTLPHKL